MTTLSTPSSAPQHTAPRLSLGAATTPGLWAALTSPRGELFAGILAGLLLLLGVVLPRLGLQPFGSALVWSSLAIGMFHGGRAAWEALRQLKFDIDVLMVVGAASAALMQKPAEGALLLFLFVLSGALEALATARTTRAVEALHKLMPTRALKLAPATTDTWSEVTPESLLPDDLIKILPGESIPADALITDGTSSINQASLTGESMPRNVARGDTLFAGTINVGNPLQARVTKPARESSLQRVLDLVIKAQQQREPVQRLIDRISQPYAIGVLAFSIAILLIWWLAFGDAFKDSAFTAMTLLIVASPCAVIIATPTATLAAITRAARAGVLFKGGQSIERLARLGAVCFDKTGTLTVGRPRVQQLHPIGWSDENRLLEAAAAVEQNSTHPIALAVRDAATERNLAPLIATNPQFTVGRGMSADIDGKPARIGNLIFTEEIIPVCLRARVREVLTSVQSHGSIGTVIAWDQQAGVIILADSVRPGAAQLVEELHTLGVRPVVMLTGDNHATAKAVADSLGLDRFFAELMPQDKVDAVARLKAELANTPSARYRAVGVIGDGVNDAPALTMADVSIAIGSIGSDAALESADIVLLSDDLSVLPWVVRLARRARRTILINLSLALTAIVIMVIAVIVGSRIGHPLPLWMGVLGHEGGTLFVVANSLILLAARSRTPIPST